METILGEPVTRYRKPSQESSPPPSPTSHSSLEAQHAAELSLKSQQSLHSFSAESLASSKPATLNTNVNTSHTALPGRQETPPSPPNSVLLNTGGDGRSPTISDSHPLETMAVDDGSKSTTQNTEIPAGSLMDKFSRVFRGHKRGSSENSWSIKGGYGRHRKDNSNSTNTTANPLPLTRIQTASSKTSVQDEPDSAEQLLFFSTSQDVSPVSLNSASQGAGKDLGRRVMNGGEVRVEIPRQIPPQGTDCAMGNSDNSMKYYDYYTRPKATNQEVEGSSDIRGQSFGVLASHDPSAARQQQELQRKPTVDTQSSSESRERRFTEDAMARRFEGFHFGVGNDGANSPTHPIPGLPRTDSDTSSRPMNADSRKASSNVLNQMAHSDSNASWSQSSSSRNATVGRRPAPNRGTSSSSFIIQGGTISKRASPEEVPHEINRLSKISAGSGVSGLAIVVTADGAASSHLPADYDEGGSYEGTGWTREEKGKGRAASSSPGTHDQRSHTRSASGGSAWTAGTDRTHTSIADNDDSRSLLAAVPEIIQTRKLMAQEPNKDVLVQPADPRYEFTYRMRQTSDDDPILVPQYRYDVPFPNRNALGPPSLARPSTLGNRMSGSILQRPPSAVLRSPTGSIPQGDDTYDARPKTTASPEQHRGSGMPLTRSSNDMNSLIHPALRVLEPPRKPRREVISMGSLEVFSSGLRGVSFIGERADTSHTPASEDGQRTTCNNDRLRPPSNAQRSSWDPSRFLSQLPARPKQFLRRSLTPRLWNPQDVDLDQTKFDPVESRQQQRKIGRMLLAACVLFPPMWFVMACGGFDPFITNWTHGAVRKVGGVEKKIALVLATLICLGAVIGVVVGISIAATN